MDGSSLDVNTPAPDAVATLGTPPSSQTIQPVPTPQAPLTTVANPGSSAGLDAQQNVHHGLLYNILDAVGSALGGSKVVNLTRDPATGKMEVSSRPASIGEKWSNVAAAAIRGAAAGASAGPGPGNMMRAAGAGGMAGVQMAAQHQQEQKQQAEQDYTQQQATQTHNANMALKNQEIAHGIFALGGEKRAGIQGMYDRQNTLAAQRASNPHNKELGFIAKPDDLPGLLASQPDIIKQHTNGQIALEPEVDKDNNLTGRIGVTYLEKDWKDQRNAEPVEQPYLARGKTLTDDPTIGTRTIPANAHTNGEIELSNQAETAKIIKASEDIQKRNDTRSKQQSEEAKNYAERNKANAEAGKATAEAGKANVEAQTLQGGADDALEAHAQQIANGDVRLPNVSRKNPYTQGLAQRVFQINPNYSDSLYTATQDLRSDKPNSMGAQITRLSTAVLHADEALKGSRALGTSPGLLTGIKTPLTAAYRQSAEFLTGEIGQYVEGGKLTISQGEDLKRDMFATLPSVREHALHEIIKLSGGKLQAQMGQFKNATRNEFPTDRVFNDPGIRDALTRHGLIGAPPQAQAPQGQGAKVPPPGAQAEIHDATGKLIGHAVNGRYVPLGAQ